MHMYTYTIISYVVSYYTTTAIGKYAHVRVYVEVNKSSM